MGDGADHAAVDVLPDLSASTSSSARFSQSTFSLLLLLLVSSFFLCIFTPHLTDHCHLLSQLNYKADGSPFWNQFFVAALRDSEGGVVNYVGVQCEVNTLPIEGIKDRYENTCRCGVCAKLCLHLRVSVCGTCACPSFDRTRPSLRTSSTRLPPLISLPPSLFPPSLSPPEGLRGSLYPSCNRAPLR